MLQRRNKISRHFGDIAAVQLGSSATIIQGIQVAVLWEQKRRFINPAPLWTSSSLQPAGRTYMMLGTSQAPRSHATFMFFNKTDILRVENVYATLLWVICASLFCYTLKWDFCTYHTIDFLKLRDTGNPRPLGYTAAYRKIRTLEKQKTSCQKGITPSTHSMFQFSGKVLPKA